MTKLRAVEALVPQKPRLHVIRFHLIVLPQCFRT
jgi:hypothetical protein